MNIIRAINIFNLMLFIQPVMQTQIDPSKLTSADQDQFTGFTYSAESALGP
jgi:hypothetical protein